MERVLLSAVVAMPSGLEVAEPADEPGGLPKRLARSSRVPDRHGLLIEGVPVAVGPHLRGGMADQLPQHDLAEFSVMVDSDTFGAAFELIQPTLEAAVDALAFQMQAALHVVACDYLDVSEPLRAGDQRDSRSDANPEALISPKFSGLPPNFRWQVFPVVVPNLHSGRFPSDPATRMALWWYVKALDVPYGVDKFLCLWTSLEILWAKSDVQIMAPYDAPCGHRIDACPVCNHSIHKQVRGASLRLFLVQHGGLDEVEARELWRLRQVVHGADVFTASRLEVLGRLIPSLQAALLMLLKLALGDPLDSAPAMLAADGPILGHEVSLLGHRIADDHDVETVSFLGSLH